MSLRGPNIKSPKVRETPKASTRVEDVVRSLINDRRRARYPGAQEIIQLSECSGSGRWILKGFEDSSGHIIAVCECILCGSAKMATARVFLKGDCSNCEEIRKRNEWLTTICFGDNPPLRRYLLRKWGKIKDRCHNENSKNYRKYGARGIHMCEEWRNNSELFLRHCKTLPNHFVREFQLDRINNFRGYEPGNIQFISAFDNSQKKREHQLMDEIERLRKELALVRG